MKGYSAAEILVVLSIITLLSAMVLVGFGGVEIALVNNSASDLVVALRRAQNMSLSVTGIGFGALNEVPLAVGVRLAKNSSEYIFFGDRVSSQDNIYTGASEKIESRFFERNIQVVSIKNDSGVEIASPVLHVLFFSPEATIQLTDGAGAVIPEKVDIVLRSPKGRQKTVTVRESGQISVKP